MSEIVKCREGGVLKDGAPGTAEPQLGIREPLVEWYSRGYVPHRDKLGLVQSVTFRLADSVPARMLSQLEWELERVPQEYQERQRRRQIEAWLDRGMGSRALHHPQVAHIVQNTFIRFDGQKYRLLAWCIMPTHVHVLVEPLIALSRIVQSWKSYTARWAIRRNEELGLGVKEDAFWMREYWDRYIRSREHLDKVVNYIHENPVKAGLCIKAEDWDWSSARWLQRD